MRNLCLEGRNVIFGAKVVPTKVVSQAWSKDSKLCELIIEQSAYLGDVLDKVPYGVVDKTVPGIGATTLEIKAKRNSIIVVPTKALAYSKSKETTKGGHSIQYVGSEVKGVQGKPTAKDLKKYAENTTIPYKKFIVVADSLPRLLKILGEKTKNYFLMVDEVDIIQSDATYRDSLEPVIDFYIKHPPKKRSLVTATFREFSDPRLKNEPKTKIAYPTLKKRNIQLLHTDNPHACVKRQIEELLAKQPKQKILVAYNSIDGILSIINFLNDELKAKCGVLCGEGSKDKVEDYFQELKNGQLPKQLTFMTCAYFVGVDINNRFDLITIANSDARHSPLSCNKLAQIAGRCRDDKGLHSEAIVYKAAEKIPKDFDVSSYKQELVKDAQAVMDIYKGINRIQKKRKSLKALFLRVKPAIVEVGTIHGIKLTRQDINQKEQISYFNIDALLERKDIRGHLYQQPDILKKRLEESGHTIENFTSKSIPVTPEQEEVERRIQGRNEEVGLADMHTAYDVLEYFCNVGIEPTREDWYSIQSSWEGESYILKYLEKLEEYYSLKDLIKLPDLLKNSKYRHRRIYNTLLFKALPDDNPFKVGILAKFKPYVSGKRIAKSTVRDMLNEVFSYHFGKSIKLEEVVPYIDFFFESNNRTGTKEGGIKILKNEVQEVAGIIPKAKIKNGENLIDLFDF